MEEIKTKCIGGKFDGTEVVKSRHNLVFRELGLDGIVKTEYALCDDGFYRPKDHPVLVRYLAEKLGVKYGRN